MQDLVDAICTSFGTTYSELGLPLLKYSREAYGTSFFFRFTKVVDTFLKANGKQWVFVFDQINHVFTTHPRCTRFDALPFPFRLVYDVQSRQRIISVISATVSNEIWYTDNFRHRGFEEYKHPPRFNMEEIQLLFRKQLQQQRHGDNINYVERMTGFVPLYVRKLLCDNQSEDSLRSEIRNDVCFFLDQFHMKSHDEGWSTIRNNMCLILLGNNFETRIWNYDRKS